MRILYGVQTTGNGHISRSREVIKELKKKGYDITVIFSGQKSSLQNDSKDFEPYKIFKGFTFYTRKGRIDYLKTIFDFSPFDFYSDLKKIENEIFDLVITDYEPLTARVAKKKKIPSIGISHQYSFLYDIPMTGTNPITKFITKKFAPVDYPIGCHWHHFDSPIVPPIIPYYLKTEKTIENKILVYLAFEELKFVRKLLSNFPDYEFYIYHGDCLNEDVENLHYRSFSRSGFLNDLTECNGIITNAGFEMASEALHIGKKVLVKPLKGQMEQTSNALAMEKLKLGFTMKKLSKKITKEFLECKENKQIRYSNIAKYIADWIYEGSFDLNKLVEKTWKLEE